MDLEKLINEQLSCNEYQDYAPNGLQVAGRLNVQKIVTGVTACQTLLDSAVAMNADAILVHHGYFWKNEPLTITGIKQKRLKTLLENDINLFSYHLPLDGHEQLGNNAQLAKLLGIELFPRQKMSDLLFKGKFKKKYKPLALKQIMESQFKRQLLHCGDNATSEIETIAFCSGAGQDYIEDAAQLGFDAFLTGEVSERTIHLAREYGIHFFCAGHHATERYGIQALGNWLGNDYGFEVTFIDIDNPA